MPSCKLRIKIAKKEGKGDRGRRDGTSSSIAA